MSSNRYKTAIKFLNAFDTLSVSTMLSIRTTNCTHIFAPSSVEALPKDNASFAAHISKLSELISSFPVTAKEIIENETTNQVIIWAVSEAKFKEELKDDGIPKEDWEYRGEYMFILNMDENGDKLERVVEFLDSKASAKAFALVKRATENKKKLAAA